MIDSYVCLAGGTRPAALSPMSGRWACRRRACTPGCIDGLVDEQIERVEGTGTHIKPVEQDVEVRLERRGGDEREGEVAVHGMSIVQR